MLTGREILIYLTIKYKGDWHRIYKAVHTREKYSSSEIKETISKIGSKILTLLDDDYPEFFKKSYCPPFVLFYHGDISLIRDYDKLLGVVGSRICSDDGVEMTRRLMEEIGNEFIILSGLSMGIEATAHKSLMNAGGKCVAVLDSGINYPYPDENTYLYEELKENHLVISEYPGFTPPTKDSMTLKYRIIAGLSKGLLIPEADKYSPAITAASFALTYGREIMCVPKTPLSESSCNQLIKEGAHLVENVEDIKSIMEGIKVKKS